MQPRQPVQPNTDEQRHRRIAALRELAAEHARSTATSLAPSPATGCNGTAPSWSPTGAQLALLDPGADRLTLWKPPHPLEDVMP